MSALRSLSPQVGLLLVAYVSGEIGQVAAAFDLPGRFTLLLVPWVVARGIVVVWLHVTSHGRRSEAPVAVGIALALLVGLFALQPWALAMLSLLYAFPTSWSGLALLANVGIMLVALLGGRRQLFGPIFWHRLGASFAVVLSTSLAAALVVAMQLRWIALMQWLSWMSSAATR